jgi:uncharacterized protein YcbX
MHIKEIWRYPVKSMAGERIENAEIGPNGIAGDRIVQVLDSRGRVATSRTYPDLLGLHAALGPDGVPTVDGRPWTDASVLDAVRAIVGPAARLVHNESVERFDILPLLVATDGSIAAFGRDGRRLRPNIVVGDVPGLEERSWPGGTLTVGAVKIYVQDLRGRCILTTFDPDTLEHDPNVLKDIVKRFGGKLALNCDVVHGGNISVNQTVEFSAP